VPCKNDLHVIHLYAWATLTSSFGIATLHIFASTAAVHEHRMEAMTALWLVPIIPG
jgi:hypothetical protein